MEYVIFNVFWQRVVNYNHWLGDPSASGCIMSVTALLVLSSMRWNNDVMTIRKKGEGTHRAVSGHWMPVGHQADGCLLRLYVTKCQVSSRIDQEKQMKDSLKMKVLSMVTRSRFNFNANLETIDMKSSQWKLVFHLKMGPAYWLQYLLVKTHDSKWLFDWFFLLDVFINWFFIVTFRNLWSETWFLYVKRIYSRVE